MTDSLWDLALRDALLATASSDPTPGGGSVAPATGAFGLALVVMALEVTHEKSKSEALVSAIARGKLLLTTIGEHVDRDIAAFQNYMQALALPKDDLEQQALRNAALQTTVVDAANTPLSAAAACLAALDYVHSLAGLVQRNVVSDLLAGADILFGSLKAVLRSVDINLPVIRDQRIRRDIAERAREIALQAEQIYLQIQTQHSKG